MGNTAPRGAAAGFLAALCMLACLPSWADAHQAQAPPEFFGVNGQQLRSFQQQPLQAQQAAHIRALGISWVRINIPWRELEPLPPVLGNHSYAWGQFDNLVEALAAQGLRLQPVLLGTPVWAANAGELVSCGNAVRPATGFGDDYAAAMRALGQRYGSGGSFWAANPGLPRMHVRQYEVWNEQNHSGFWCPAPEPERYAQIFVAASAALRAADPAAQVGIGGLSPVRASGADRVEVGEFLRRATAARPDLAGHASLVFAHPYATRPEDVIGQLGWWRQSINSSGLAGKPIVTNEWGWHTRGQASATGSIPEQQRAANYSYVASSMSRTLCGVIGTAPHTWVSAELNPGNREDWYGIASSSGAGPYETGLAYGGGIALMEGRAAAAPPTDVVPVCGAGASGAARSKASRSCALKRFKAKRRSIKGKRRRSKVVLRFNSRRAARVVIAVKQRRRGKWRRIGRISRRVPAGRSRKRWSGKLGRRKLSPRKSYRLEARVKRDSVGCKARVTKLKRKRR